MLYASRLVKHYGARIGLLLVEKERAQQSQQVTLQITPPRQAPGKDPSRTHTDQWFPGGGKESAIKLFPVGIPRGGTLSLGTIPVVGSFTRQVCQLSRNLEDLILHGAY